MDDGVRQFKFEKMPFTAEQLFRVFEKYNHAVFPIQILLICAAVAAVVLARKPRGFSGPVVTGVLAFLWFWSGVTYHLTFFTEINPAAYIFAALFVVQACLFIYQGIRKNHLKFRFERNIYGILGAALVVYALVAYPLIGYVLGHAFSASPTFGAPCPMVIFTFGLMMWTEKLALSLLFIPVLWAFISLSAAVRFGMKEDCGLLIAATIGAGFIIRRDLVDKKEVLL